MRAVAVFVALILPASPALAQHQHPDAGRPSAATLHPGLGDHHHPITTKSAEAQRFFNQGLVLLYGFNHDEAARSFRRVAELDADAAMAYWGLALAIGPNYNDTALDEHRARTTYEAVRRAVEFAPKVSAREQAYIRALTKRFASADPKSDWKKFHSDYSDAMREVVKKYPDDLDAAVLFAESLMMLRPWQLWTLDGDPAPGTLELVAVLESVLKHDPDHPAANHFYIHAVEASPNLERAIPSAMRLMNLVPGAGHLVHMPGHIFLQTGDYDLAAKTNIDAAAADKAFVDRTGATGVYPLMYWTHNIHFISYARAQQGRYDEAREAANQMARQIGDADREMQMLEAFLVYPLVADLRFHRWDAILSSPAPTEQRKLSRAFWQYGQAMALAGKGLMTEASTARRRFEALRQSVPAESMFLLNNKSSDVLNLAGATLDASIAWARGDHDGAVEHWRRALELERAIQYDEPPAWHYPIAQSLGAALLRSGKGAEAEEVFRAAVAKKPRDGRLLFGLWQSLVAQKRDGEAKLVEHQFNAAWKDAPVPLKIEDL
jgi:tetratricopeptide (TPR) repeat protein